MKSLKTILAAAAAGLFAVGGAHAAAAYSQAVVNGVNQLSDDDAEMILKFDGSLNGGAGGYRAFQLGDVLGGGDIFIGMVGMTSFPTGALGTSASLYNEITAIYAVQAASGAPTNPLSCGSPALTTCGAFGFIPPTIGLNAAFATANAVYGTTISAVANVSATSFAVVKEDSTPDFARTAATAAAAFATADDGVERFVLGLGGANDFFFATAPANPNQLGLINVGANGGSLSAKATIEYQNVPSWLFSPTVDITGNIQRAGSGPFQIWTDSTYTLNATFIPEPASIALTGLALLGAGLAGRRSRKAK